jgi:hypothetical protein
MAIELITKDCAALEESELEELSELAENQGVSFGLDFLNQQKEQWVLSVLASEEGRILGGILFTLERIGGTPCVLVNLVITTPKDREREVAGAMLHEAYSRAVLAFPDEDVLVGAKLVAPTGYDLFGGLHDIVPRPGHKPTGEERAWSRRLAKRFGLDQGLDDRSSLAKGSDGKDYGFVAYRLMDASTTDFDAVFECCKPSEGEALIVYGWAMAEDLAEGALPVI